MAYDNAGSILALGMRLTKLDILGAPLIGDDTCYVTNALVAVGIGLEYEEGTEVVQKAGSGRVCLTYQAPSTLKRGTISDLQFCTPDPNVLEFCIGGTVITTGGAGTAEIQTVTLTGSPTDGTFTLTLDGQTTGPIDSDAAAAAVELALEALSNVGVGNATVAGSAGGPWTVTFGVAMGNVSQLTGDGSGLTGGSSPAVAIATTTPGSNLTDIGYAAPEVGVEARPYGISIEMWSQAVDDGALASELPYFHWVLPRTQLRTSDTWTLEGENALLPGFEGFGTQNQNWGSGPAGDWPYISSRVWQFARTAEAPEFETGFVSVA